MLHPRLHRVVATGEATQQTIITSHLVPQSEVRVGDLRQASCCDSFNIYNHYKLWKVFSRVAEIVSQHTPI